MQTCYLVSVCSTRWREGEGWKWDDSGKSIMGMLGSMVVNSILEGVAAEWLLAKIVWYGSVEVNQSRNDRQIVW